MAPGDVQADPPRLTTRERQVLLAVADRLSNSDIAEQLCLSKRTVEAHVSALYAKTGATTRRQLVAMGERHRERQPPGSPVFAPASTRRPSWQVAHDIIDQRVRLTRLHLDRSREQAARARLHVRTVSQRHETPS